MPLMGDKFNPGDVYLLGSLDNSVPKPNDYYAIAHWSDPNTACVGFDPQLNGGEVAIGPTDGRLYYLNNGDATLRQFKMESCGAPTEAAYPAYPVNNDKVIPTTQCGTFGIKDFRLSLDGDLYYVCNNGDASWVWDQTGAKVFDGSGHLRQVGLSRIALLEFGVDLQGRFIGGTFKIANFATGTQTEVAWAGGKPMNLSGEAVRALDNGGFWVGWKNGGDAQLWEVTPDANGKLLGVYPAPPQVNDLFGAGALLDGCQGLIQWGHNIQDQNILIRRDLMGHSVIGYNMSDGPLLQVGPTVPVGMVTAP
jgi:hypothetical protein